ncbi:MAG: hypothetical protein PVSMB10_04570 [Pseudarthrobacter sp.]
MFLRLAHRVPGRIDGDVATGRGRETLSYPFPRGSGRSPVNTSGSGKTLAAGDNSPRGDRDCASCLALTHRGLALRMGRTRE